MKYTPTEIEALIYAIKCFIGVSVFFGSMAVIALFNMAATINKFKTLFAVQKVEHDQLQKEHNELKSFVFNKHKNL
jgi:hypothetical protein